MADDKLITKSNSEVGAPVAKDAIDPELINLRRKRTPIGAVAAIGIVVLCVTLSLRLWPDMRYSRVGDHPTVVAGAAAPHRDELVDVDVQLDYARAVRLRQSASSSGQRAVPVRGRGDALWIVMGGGDLAGGDALTGTSSDSHYVGRARALNDVTFGAELRHFVEAHPAPQFFTAEVVRAALASNATSLTNVEGETVALGAADAMEVDGADRDAAKIVVAFNERFADAKAWATVLAAAGLITADQPPSETGRDTARFLVKRPDAVASITKALHDASLWGARVEPVTTTLRATWAQAQADGGVALSLASPATGSAPYAVDLVRVMSARHIPVDAMVVLVDEKPGDYWYVLPVVIALGVLGLLFAWAGIRAVKRDWLAPPAV